MSNALIESAVVSKTINDLNAAHKEYVNAVNGLQGDIDELSNYIVDGEVKGLFDKLCSSLNEQNPNIDKSTISIGNNLRSNAQVMLSKTQMSYSLPAVDESRTKPILNSIDDAQSKARAGWKNLEQAQQLIDNVDKRFTSINNANNKMKKATSSNVGLDLGSYESLFNSASGQIGTDVEESQLKYRDAMKRVLSEEFEAYKDIVSKAETSTKG